MAELSPSGFDLMARAVRRLTIVHAPSDARGWGNALSAVLWLVWIDKSRASSIVGPNAIQVIIDGAGNTWQGFPFLFAICFASALITSLAVGVPKGRWDAERWAAEQRSTASIMWLGRKARGF